MSTYSDSSAISVRGISKRYGIGTQRRTASVVDKLGRLMTGTDRNPFADSTIWALRSVSFDVPRGHVLGIVGRNGSGKTTLMRVLARVTAPTEGSAIVRGRVGAMFQMGTGFHPELSGRDNIGLSGAILGMSRAETDAVFDRIVDFAEIGEFLDTPVKHYSTGMYARLAFSVSAHLNAEVLLIDEGLSVGDATFSKKSGLHIREMVRSGRTVVFISHDLSTVAQLCDSALVLEQGELRYSGGAADAIEYYRELLKETADQPLHVPVRLAP